MVKLILTDIDADDLFGPANLTGTPERNLLTAILMRAILDFVGNDEKEIETSRAWIFDDLEDTEPATPYSFPWLCQQLDLVPADIAAKIRAMPKRGKRRIAPWYFTKQEEQKLAS